MKKAVLLISTFFPSGLRLLCWRWLGFRVGKSCRVSAFSIIIAGHVELGDGCIIEPFNFIYQPCSFVMGDSARISAFTRIVGYGRFTMGRQSFVALGNLVDCTSEFILGERSHLGPRCTCYTHGESGLIFNRRYPNKDNPAVTIGHDCRLMMACTVYPGISIGDGSVVLAGIVVSQNIKADSVLIPSPGFITRNIQDLQSPVDEGKQKEFLDHLFRMCAEVWQGEITAPAEGVRLLRFHRDRRIILLDNGASMDLTSVDRAKTVVWTLNSQRVSPDNVPHFQFKDLTITGGWTPLAARIAALLCERSSTHFVFNKD